MTQNQMSTTAQLRQEAESFQANLRLSEERTNFYSTGPPQQSTLTCDWTFSFYQLWLKYDTKQREFQKQIQKADFKHKRAFFIMVSISSVYNKTTYF